MAQCKQRIFTIPYIHIPWRLTYKTGYLINNVSRHLTSATGTLYKRHHNTEKYKHLILYDYGYLFASIVSRVSSEDIPATAHQENVNIAMQIEFAQRPQRSQIAQPTLHAGMV